MILKYLVVLFVFALFVCVLHAESYAFRLTNWKDVENSYRLEIYEFDIHTQDEFNLLSEALEKDPNLIKISTTFNELRLNLGKNYISFDNCKYKFFPYGIIINTTAPFLISTRDTKLESRFTFNGTLSKGMEGEFTIDYSYERFGPTAFSIKKKESITLDKMYFIASTWDLPKRE